jgi:tRNA A-37 threonylcarbamoyl transferase component Bud32
MPFFCIHCKSEIDPKFKACPFCGEAITDFLRRYLETPIDGKYRILSRLGIGGMGEVYKVLHIHLNAIRVIKLMRANIAGDTGANERFLREARLATKIQHPSVAALFDFSTLEDGSHYMVWEYIEGINLHELIDQRGPLSPRYAAKLAVQALMGLDAIHRAGIVHRDISPENLMITREVGDDVDERVKVIDLGIAKSLAADDNNTKTGMFVGKWKYCSPEHLGMLPPEETIDGRADLYSFGIVLYEMLTGVPPFQADTPHAYLMLHSQQRPKALRDVNPLVSAPPELEALIFRALEKDRSKRFASAREFAQALERIAPGLPDVGGAPPPLPATADVTDDATRMTPKFAPDALTVLTTEEAEVTRISDRELFAVPAPPEPAAPEPRRGARWLAPVAAALIAAVAGGWYLTRDDKPADAPPANAVQAATIPIQQPPAPAVTAITPGHLAINAFPWATVASIRNLDNGEAVDIGAKLVTPAMVDVAPGRYELTLTNPDHPRVITRTVTVPDGQDATLTVHFVDPARAVLPDFGGAR